MNLSRIRSLCYILITVVLLGCSKPLMVTHWSAKDRALLKKPKNYGWPAHKWYSKVVCFDPLCRKKAAWVKKQRESRFKGFKDGGKLPPSQPRKVVSDSAVMIARKPTSVKPAPTTVTQAPVTLPAAPPKAAVKADSLIVLNEVLFAVNSFKLQPALYPKLDSIVMFMKRNPSTKIEISGHTDSTGKEAHNLKLSEDRADAVAEYVVDKGIALARVSFNGYGSSRPIASNDNDQGRRKNRRVEILIHDRK